MGWKDGPDNGGGEDRSIRLTLPINPNPHISYIALQFWLEGSTVMFSLMYLFLSFLGQALAAAGVV